jgi:hypothetical protein
MSANDETRQLTDQLGKLCPFIASTGQEIDGLVRPDPANPAQSANRSAHAPESAAVT